MIYHSPTLLSTKAWRGCLAFALSSSQATVCSDKRRIILGVRGPRRTPGVKVGRTERRSQTWLAAESLRWGASLPVSPFFSTSVWPSEKSRGVKEDEASERRTGKQGSYLTAFFLKIKQQSAHACFAALRAPAKGKHGCTGGDSEGTDEDRGPYRHGRFLRSDRAGTEVYNTMVPLVVTLPLDSCRDDVIHTYACGIILLFCSTDSSDKRSDGKLSTLRYSSTINRASASMSLSYSSRHQSDIRMTWYWYMTALHLRN